MLCPRREEGPTSFKLPAEDHWRENETCSFCGSLNPEAFMRHAEAGAKLGPTDKSYKVYVDTPEPNPDEVIVVGMFTSGTDNKPPTADYVKYDPAQHEEILKRSGWGRTQPENTWLRFGKRGATRFGKFYFQHLDVEQQKKFIELLNAKKLNIGMPGHFYVLPFFMRAEKATP